MFRGRPQPRPLSSYVARALIPRAVLFGALAAALLVGQAMSVDPLAAPAESSGTSLPSWTTGDASANPGCVSAETWPEGGLADAVVAYASGDRHGVRLPFDTAWRVNHDETEVNDVWVVGICP